MPILSNQRHERFAQELAKGKCARESYVLAGYKPNDGNASVLKSNQKVLDRVEELQGKAAAKVEVTVESLIRESEEVRQAALRDGQLSAAMAAIKEKGVLAGVRVEKKETKDLTDIGDSELSAVLDRLMVMEQAMAEVEGDLPDGERLN